MIERTQEMFYELCDKTPAESWDYTQAEILQMVNVKIKIRDREFKNDQIKHADLINAIYNAPYGPYLKKGDRYPYKIQNFLPKGTIKREEISQKERSRRLLEAGNAMMEAVEQYERR